MFSGGSAFPGFNRRLIYFIIISLLFLFASLNSHSQTRSELFDKYLREYKINKGVPSISAGVLLNDTLVWQKAEGTANIDRNLPALNNSLYRIASISKMITAVAVMQLAEQRNLNIDDDALKYIPYFPRKRWSFSIRRILNHTSGLRSYRPGEFNSLRHYPSIKDAVNMISTDTLMFKPGSSYLYTTLGYNLLGAVIESASGMSYLNYVKKNIFLPAGMDSTFADFEKVGSPYRVEGYSINIYRRLQYSPAVDLSEKLPGGGFISTSGDMLKFAKALLDGKLISGSTLDSMTAPTILKNGRKIYYGLGMELMSDKEGRNYFGHFGYGTGFRSLLVINKQTRSAAVHLINLNDRDLGVPAMDLASIADDSQFIKPAKILNKEMMTIILNKGVDSSIAFYKSQKANDAGFYNFSEKELHYLGYDLIRMRRTKDAIKIFELFRGEYPSSISAIIGLGDSYNNLGDKKTAKKFFSEVLLLSPENSYAKTMIKRLIK